MTGSPHYVEAELSVMMATARNAIETRGDMQAMMAFYWRGKRRFTAMFVGSVEDWLPLLPRAVPLACVDTIMWLADSFMLYGPDKVAAVKAGEAARPSENPESVNVLHGFALTYSGKGMIGITDSVSWQYVIADDGSAVFDSDKPLQSAQPDVTEQGTFPWMLAQTLILPRAAVRDEPTAAMEMLRRYAIIQIPGDRRNPLGRMLLPPTKEDQ